MGRKAKKGSSRYYFTQKTEDAIVRYNKETRAFMKNRIYNDHIRRAFDKLVENIIHTFKFYYFDVSSEQVKHEVVSFLVLNIHKFTEGKGKAFSYFSIVAKNYLILHNNKNYSHYKQHDKIEVLDWNSRIKDKHKQEDIDDLNREYVNQFIEYWENNLTNVFRRKKDILVADSILEIFRRSENIENFNKKALYIMIREMTGSNTQHITRVINQMKNYYVNMMTEFQEGGKIDTATTGSIF